MRILPVLTIALIVAGLGAACGSTTGKSDFTAGPGGKDATADNGTTDGAGSGDQGTSNGNDAGNTMLGGGDTGAGAGGDGGCGTCASLGFNCGNDVDMCGHPINCGTCTAPQFCGGGGTNTCGGILDAGGCTPKTCQQQGISCGPAGDGCGNMLSCGTCQAPQSCGGGGTPGACGSSVPCTGLCLNQVVCDAGGTTSLSGTVVAGTLPVYGNPDPVPNVLVYVPNAPVQPFTPGVTCSQCGADVSGDPLIETLTDYKGNFTLNNVPVPPGGMVPLVIQLGRWRKYMNLSFPVTACTANSAGQITMPRTEAEGDIPLTALSTGNVDALECVLLKMGIDQSEFTLPGGTGRVQMFLGNGSDDGAGTPAESALTTNPTTLANYDQILFPCWGEDPIATDPDYSPDVVKTPAEQTNLIDYTTAGGRMFATHFSYAWTYDDSPFSTTASWIPDQEPDDSVLAVIQQTPTEVGTFYAWMNYLGPLNNGAVFLGLFNVNAPRDDFSAINSATSELWVTSPGYPLLFTFNTPVGQASQCGRVVYSTFHVTVVNTASGETSGTTFPAECTTAPLQAQEKALEYLLWDLASCVPPPPTTMCTPETCQSQNIACGPAGDGCGNLLQCGMCVAPQTCGGGGVPGQCGFIDGGSCTPNTCAGQNIACGPAGDGCGNTLQCGPCVPPQTCGGGGVPGQCGGGNRYDTPVVSLSFLAGTVELRGLPAGAAAPPVCTWDERTRCLRAPAVAYADVVRALVAAKVPFEDAARKYEVLEAGARVHREPRPFQTEALDAWRANRGRGLVVLPTGAGKSHVALLAIDDKRRSTLVVAPTLDLVRQWYNLLGATFGGLIGVVGGGDHDVQPLTVTTYDSAMLHMDHLGARFGMVVFDECHHLPSAGYALAARACLAPFRMGLTATPERADGREAELASLVGPLVYRKDIVELSGDYLAEYATERISIELSREERREHDAERAIYRDFVTSHGIRMSQPSGWGEFIMLSSQSAEGRRAMSAYRRQRELAFAPRGKLEYLEHLLFQHRKDRAILFTQDNATAYGIARRFLVPVITHQTKVRERSEILRGLAEGSYRAVVTSKVLNEGVDVPDANVAIILSGSGSVREHVQRLGRILRKNGDKRAVLYELVTEATTETYTSERRREHSAYR